MGIIGRRFRKAGHRKLGFVVVSGLAAVSMLTLGAAAFAAGGPVLSKKGATNEGPYPYAYPASGNIKAGTGTTVNGSTCTPSTPQFNGAYAAPCVPKFTGNNGGATSNGVTSNTITLAQLEYPTSANAQELQAEAAAAGVAPQPVTQPGRAGLPQLLQQGLRALRPQGRHPAGDRHGELHPRRRSARTRRRPVPTPPPSLTQVHAFGETGIPYEVQGGGSAPFSQCAAQRAPGRVRRGTATSARTSSRGRTPTSGRPSSAAPTSRPRWPR